MKRPLIADWLGITLIMVALVTIVAVVMLATV